MESSPARVKQLSKEGWMWMVRCYYGPGGRKGTSKNPNLGRVGEREGDLAIETVHKSEASKNAEVAAGASREDIGRVQVIDLRASDDTTDEAFEDAPFSWSEWIGEWNKEL